MNIRSSVALVLFCVIAKPVNAEEISKKAITYGSIATITTSLGVAALLNYMANKYNRELLNRDISEDRRNIIERNIKTCHVLMGLCGLGVVTGIAGTGYGLLKWNNGSIGKDEKQKPDGSIEEKPNHSDSTGKGNPETPSNQPEQKPTTISEPNNIVITNSNTNSVEKAPVIPTEKNNNKIEESPKQVNKEIKYTINIPKNQLKNLEKTNENEFDSFLGKLIKKNINIINKNPEILSITYPDYVSGKISQTKYVDRNLGSTKNEIEELLEFLKKQLEDENKKK